MVLAQSMQTLDHPTVRLLFDRQGHSLSEGVEVKMQDQPHNVALHSLSETGTTLGEQAFNADGTPTDPVLKPHFVQLEELLAAGLAVDDVAMAHTQR